MGFFKNIAKAISVKNIVKVATGQGGDVVKEVVGRVVKEVSGGSSSSSTSSIAAAAQNAVSTALTGASRGVVANAVTKALATSGTTLPASATIKTPAVAVKSAVSGTTKTGILGTKISTGNATVDKVLSGAASGALGAVSSEKPVKDISETLGNIVAKNWFERNWYYVAGGAVALLTLMRGRRGKR